MLELLKSKNKDIKFFSVFDDEFDEYGRVVSDFDASEIISVAEKTEKPQEGAKYFASLDTLENTSCSKTFKHRFFGGLPAQIGYCFGYNNLLNATEWHTSSEINVAVTDLCLLLAKRSEIKNGSIDSSKFKAFFVPKGTTLEVYATSLHFTPCQVSKDGFGCVVMLPLGTNTPLEEKEANSLLWAKNKWLLSHIENTSLIGRGAVGGITGKNLQIKF